MPIEQIREGDLVAAKDEVSGEVVWKPVVRLFRNAGQEIVRVSLMLDDGTAEDIGASLEHPFWVEGSGWTAASDLQPDDKLIRLHGGEAAVASVEHQTEREDTYNFEVADVHTYFVGDSGVWVHNQSKALFQEFFRGARSGKMPDFVPKPNEFKVDSATGFVRTTHGVSIYDNPSSVRSNGFIPYRVDQSSIPDSLRIIRRGDDPRHFEIVPRPGANLTPQQFIDACSSITCTK